MRIELSIGLHSRGGGASAPSPGTVLAAALNAYNPALLLLADSGATADLSANARHPYGPGNGSLSAIPVVANRFRDCAAFSCDGTKAMRIPPFAARHVFAVARHDFHAWPDYYAMYLSGGSGSFDTYVFAGNLGGTLDSWAGNANHSRTLNGVFFAGMTNASLSWDSRQHLDALNIYEDQLAAPSQTAVPHILGWDGGNLPRAWRGDLFALVAFPDILSAGDRAAVLELLRARYQSHRIVCHGDSLTHGVGATLTQSQYADNYPRQLLALYGKTNRNLWFTGIQGATAPQLAANAGAIDAMKGDVLCVWMGTNDVGFANQSAASTKTVLDNYLAARRAANPATKILVLTLRPSTTAASSNPSGYNTRAPALNTLLTGDARYANGVLAHGLVRVDQLPQWQDPADTTYCADGLHGTAAAYAAVAAATKTAIDAL